jgi:hypothetical protein
MVTLGVYLGATIAWAPLLFFAWTHALAIARFYAVGTGIGGIVAGAPAR